MTTTISYDTYNQATPFSSITHVYVFLKSITANGVAMNSMYNAPLDLVSQQIQPINNLQSISIENQSYLIPSFSINIGPTATIVLGNGSQFTVPVSTSITVPVYAYNNLMVSQPFQISKGQNKTVLILWNLSELSTSSTTLSKISARGFDRNALLTLNAVHFSLTQDPGVYRFAQISDFASSYAFTAQAYWNSVNDAFNFTLYPFKAITSLGYKANISIQSATQTIVSTTITINASNISLTL